MVVEEPRADHIDVPVGRVAQDLRSFGSYTTRTIYGGRGGIAERRTPGVWTPPPDGLRRMDFIMAATVDRLVE
ncbi:MAG: hypothetical protein H0V97_08290 [Actinobacteria bacterium]|nr:hypothetical protein [Actinomycetota bacterium]